MEMKEKMKEENMTKRKFLGSVAVAAAALVLMGTVAFGIGGRGRRKPDTGPFGWPHLQTVKEKLDLGHGEAEALLRIYNRYEHDQKQNAQSSKTGDKVAGASGDGELKEQALAEIRKALGEATFRRFEELIGGKRKK